MDIKDRISEVYKEYDGNIRKAHAQIIQLEKSYRNRSRKESEEVQKLIMKIIEEVSDDN